MWCPQLAVILDAKGGQPTGSGCLLVGLELGSPFGEMLGGRADCICSRVTVGLARL